MDIIISLISSLYILVIIHKFSVFRSDRCNRWLKTYDRESTVVYKFFAFNRFNREKSLGFHEASYDHLQLHCFSSLYSDNDGDERPMQKSHVLCIFGESTQQRHS